VRGSALIKHYFGVNPANLDDEEWAQLVAEAQYIAGHNALLIAREIEQLLLRTGILKKQ